MGSSSGFSSGGSGSSRSKNRAWKRSDRATTVSITAPRSSLRRWTSSMMMSLPRGSKVVPFWVSPFFWLGTLIYYPKRNYFGALG